MRRSERKKEGEHAIQIVVIVVMPLVDEKQVGIGQKQHNGCNAVIEAKNEGKDGDIKRIEEQFHRPNRGKFHPMKAIVGKKRISIPGGHRGNTVPNNSRIRASRSQSRSG